MNAGTPCEQCGNPVADNDVPGGAVYMRCAGCDPEGEHIATTFPQPGGPCATCHTATATPGDNPGCHTSVDLGLTRAYLGPRIDAVRRATSPTQALSALTDLENGCRKARERIAVHLVCDDGWSYAQLGRALGVTRQATAKQYAPAVADQLRRNLRTAR